jgi:hypothetical protein
MTEESLTQRPTVGRRSVLKAAAVAGIVAIAGETVHARNDKDHDRDKDRRKHHGKEHGRLSKGDAAILRFLAAAEIIDTELWQQYNEHGGIHDDEVPGGSGNAAYTDALAVLDEDMAQYIHDNTEDELTHELFLNAYLVAHGAEPADLEQFRTLPSSKATGAQQIGRLTNLMQLTLDLSWWSRYRDPDNNPDLDPDHLFPLVVPDLASGQFPAIPRDNSDLTPTNHLQAIAYTAAFHFPSIEVGGTSLYPSLAQRVNDAEALRIVLSIGPVEAMHFQTWQDKVGHVSALTDPTNGLTFPDISSGGGGELLQNNLIMPEPCPFLSNDLPDCSIVRPTETEGAAMGALAALTAQGLFIGQSDKFFEYMRDLAADADAARRDGP